MTSPYVRADSAGRSKLKRIPPLCPREFRLLLFEKALEMIDKSESIYWATDFEGQKLARVNLEK